MCYLSMLRVWLCRARKDTGESIASLLLAHSLTTLRPVWWIFSVSWSTAMLLGAHTSTGLEGQKAQDHLKDQNTQPRHALRTLWAKQDIFTFIRTNKIPIN